MFELSGNAFAITPTKVVTAFHYIYDDLFGNTDTNESNLTIYRDAIICEKVTKDSKNQPFYHDPILVKLCDYNYDNDWAVLELVKGKTCFSNQLVQEQPVDMKYLEICPFDYLPREGYDELKVHCYDISLFNRSIDREEKLICQRYNYSRIRLLKEISHIYRVQDGLSKGSCGCPYISKSNMVVAIHIASLNSSLQRESRTRFHYTSYAKLTEQNSASIFPSEVTTNSDNISNLSDETSSVADNFFNYKEGFILCTDEQFKLHLKNSN